MWKRSLFFVAILASFYVGVCGAQRLLAGPGWGYYYLGPIDAQERSRSTPVLWAVPHHVHAHLSGRGNIVSMGHLMVVLTFRVVTF